MASISFSPNILNQVKADLTEVDGTTLAEAMANAFAECPSLKSYLLNDDGTVRKHIAFVIDGAPIRDRQKLSDPISDGSEIFVMQALSGG